MHKPVHKGIPQTNC